MMKRIAKILLALTMAIVLSLGVTMFSFADGTAGDIDNDGKINSKDSLRLKQYLSGMVEIPDEAKARCDLNGDFIISQVDSDILRAIIAHII